MNTDNGQENLAASLRELARGAREQGWLIVLCVVTALGGAYAYSELKTPVYESSTKVLILSGGLPGSDPSRQRATDIELVSSPVVAQRAGARAKLRSDEGTKLEGVSIAAQGDSNVVTIATRSTKPKLAALMAQALAEEYIAFRQETALKRFQTSLRVVRTRIRELMGDPSGRAKVELKQLRDRARGLRLSAGVQTGDAQIVQKAAIPTVPVEPNKSRNLLLGGVFGSLLGIALAFLRHRLDRRIKTMDQMEKLIGDLPILAFIPRIEPGDSSQLIAAESFHTLHASLSSMSGDGSPRSILITSPMGGEGKTSTTANLAIALQERGRSSLILDADLRRPGLSAELQMEWPDGVASVLAGIKTLDECVSRVTFSPSQTDGSGPKVALRGEVGLVPAGKPFPEQPWRLFNDRSTEALLSAASAHSDTVLVDGPPLGMFSDMVPVARRVDAVVLMVRLGVTRGDTLERMIEQLATFGVTPLGVVVLESSADTAGYGYYYDH